MRCAARSLPYVIAASSVRREPGHSNKTDAADIEAAEARKQGEHDACEEEEQQSIKNTKETKRFEAAACAAECPQLVLEAARATDEAMQSLERCFHASTDYLNLLAQVFTKALAAYVSGRGSSSDSEEVEAPLFYMLVPALSLSFLHALIAGQDALMRRAGTVLTSSTSNALCFDDGFAVGVACILRILGQDKQFQALHWFEAEVPPDDPAGNAPKEPIEATGPRPLTRQEVVEREKNRLAATLEAASSLFTPPDCCDE